MFQFQVKGVNFQTRIGCFLFSFLLFEAESIQFQSKDPILKTGLGFLCLNLGISVSISSKILNLKSGLSLCALKFTYT